MLGGIASGAVEHKNVFFTDTKIIRVGGENNDSAQNRRIGMKKEIARGKVRDGVSVMAADSTRVSGPSVSSKKE